MKHEEVVRILKEIGFQFFFEDETEAYWSVKGKYIPVPIIDSEKEMIEVLINIIKKEKEVTTERIKEAEMALDDLEEKIQENEIGRRDTISSLEDIEAGLCFARTRIEL